VTVLAEPLIISGDAARRGLAAAITNLPRDGSTLAE
jgi:hypothetical protein